jgi:phage shock protein A
MEEQDPSARARAHMELARIAVTRGEADLASRHLREALELDPRLKRARERLHEVEELSQVVRDKVRGRRKKAISILRKFRRK